MESKEVRIILAICMVIGAVLTVVTCLWKLIRLYALFQIETRFDELESLSKAKVHEGNGENCPKTPIMSPKEARNLRRLSVLAGFDRKPSSSVRSSFSEAATNLRRSFRLLSLSNRTATKKAEGHEARKCEATNDSDEVRLRSSSFLTSNPQCQPLACSRITVESTDGKICAIHGSMSQSSNLNAASGESAHGGLNGSGLTPPPPPPVSSSRFFGASFDDDKSTKLSQTSPYIPWTNVKCVNPNHYHHFHHHESPLPITLTLNPSFSASCEALNCVLCHLHSAYCPGSKHHSPDASPVRVPDEVEEGLLDRKSDDTEGDDSEEVDEDEEEDEEELEEEDTEADRDSLAQNNDLASSHPDRDRDRDNGGRDMKLHRNEVTVHWNGPLQNHLHNH